MWALAGILVTAVFGYFGSVKPTRLTLAANERARLAADERHRAEMEAARLATQAAQADTALAREKDREDRGRARRDARRHQALDDFKAAMALWGSDDESEQLTGMTLLSGMIADDEVSDLVKTTLDAFTSKIFNIRLAELRKILDETGHLPDVDVEFIDDEGEAERTNDDDDQPYDDQPDDDPDEGGALT